MRGDFWGQFVNERIVDRVHGGPKRVMFLLEFDNLFFQPFYLTLDICPLFACGTRATFHYSTGDWEVLGIDSFTTAASPCFHHRIVDGWLMDYACRWLKHNKMV